MQGGLKDLTASDLAVATGGLPGHVSLDPRFDEAEERKSWDFASSSDSWEDLASVASEDLECAGVLSDSILGDAGLQPEPENEAPDVTPAPRKAVASVPPTPPCKAAVAVEHDVCWTEITSGYTCTSWRCSLCSTCARAKAENKLV